MLPDKMEHCIVFMNSWDVSGAFWSFSKCNIIIPHLPADPSTMRAQALQLATDRRARVGFAHLTTAADVNAASCTANVCIFYPQCSILGTPSA